MSQEPNIIKAESLDDLSNVYVDFTIPRPDGKQIQITMRTLSYEEVMHIRRGAQWPKPPVKDINKIDGRLVEQYDETDTDYQRQLEEVNNDQAYRILLASLVLNIPGADDEERIANLKSRLGMWAFNHLVRASTAIHFPSVAEVAQTALSFRYPGRDGAQSDDGSQSDAGPVGETAEG